MKVIGFVIHLRRASMRLPLAEKLCKKCDVSCEILDAFDGSALDQSAQDKLYQPSLLKPTYPFSLGAGEIGCFMSHRYAWTCLLKSKADAALILEDDMQITTGFADASRLAQRHILDFGYIQFQTRDVTGNVIDTENNARLFHPEITPLRTSGQLVSRKAAQQLLDQTMPFDRPIDSFLQMHWQTGIQIASISPSGLVDMTGNQLTSTISKSISIKEKISREFRRAKYRRAIAQLSRLGQRT